MHRNRSLIRRALLGAVIVLLLAPAARAAKDPATKSKLRCGEGLFCAGAATGDITPPVTSPQFAYTFRNCATATAVEVGSRASEPQDHVEEGQSWLLGGGPSCAASKVAPDTELYNKTWPPSEGTYGRLQANAFVLDDGKGQRQAIVQADLGGIPGQLHTYVAERVASLGIDRSNLMISATHTHGGPGGIFQDLGYATAGGDQYDPRIFEAVASGVVTAIERAAARVQPAKLAIGFGTIEDANGNRSKDAWELNPENKLGLDTPDAERLMLIRLDTTKGLPLGVITNFANHGVIHGTFNYWMSGDNQGTTTRRVAAGIAAAAKANGVRLPRGWKVVDALINGSTGDISPRSDDGGWTFEQYGYDDGLDNAPPFQEFAAFENAGMRQAPEALRLWDSLEGRLTSDVTLDARLDFVCLCGQEVGDDPHDPYDRGEFEPPNDDPAYRSISREAILGADDGSSFPTTVFPSHSRETPRLIAHYPGAPMTTRVQVLRINGLGLASMPGEPTIQMGRRIERSVLAAGRGLFDDVVSVGLANDYMSYMATIQEYEAYQYEGGFSLYGQQTGNLLKERLVQLTDAMREGAELGPCTEDRGCMEPPDTSNLAYPPTPLVPDVMAGTIEQQPADVERFVGTSFAWVGGGPSAEWSPNDPIVELQRQVGKKWRTVATDLDPDLPVRYKKQQALNHWRVHFDPTKDFEPGTYRFHVTGQRATGPATKADYVLDSEPFAVSRSTALTLERSKEGVCSVVHPAPDAAANYRYRERVAATARVNGTPGPTFPCAEDLVLPPGAIVDAWGNTNGQAVQLTA